MIQNCCSLEDVLQKKKKKKTVVDQECCSLDKCVQKNKQTKKHKQKKNNFFWGLLERCAESMMLFH